MGENVVLVYLVVCFFVFLAGFVDSIAGGGGLISLPAYMIAGLPVHTAIATNKMSSSMGTFVASFHYMKKGFMKWKICEEYWIWKIRYLAERKMGKELKQSLQALKEEHIYLSSRGKEALGFWLDGSKK
mgnify:CR=1 FL=1